MALGVNFLSKTKIGGMKDIMGVKTQGASSAGQNNVDLSSALANNNKKAEAKPDANTSIDDNDQRSRFVDFMKALFSRRNIEIAGGTAAVAAVVISTAAFLKKGGK